MKTLIKLLLLLLLLHNLSLAQQEGENISLGKYRLLHSEILNEDRILLVTLPDNYESSGFSFPVLYLLYGDQVKGYYAETVNIVSRLSEEGTIPQLIIVGIANIDRYRDCLPLQPNGNPGGADKFLRFFKEELNQFINNNYRTKNFQILAGPQAGAAFGLYSLFEKSDLFNAIIVSNPFWTKHTRQYFLEKAEYFLKTDSVPKKFMFISYWDKEGWQDQLEAIDALTKFAKIYETEKPAKLSLHLNYISNNEDFIPPIGLKEGLKRLFQNYGPKNCQAMNTLADIQKYYFGISKEYGYDIDIPELLLVGKSDDLQNKGNLAEAKNILDFIILKNPTSLNALLRKANIHRVLGEYDSTFSYYDKFLKIRKEPFIEHQLQLLLKFKEESAVFILEPILNTEGIEAMLRKYQDLRKDANEKRTFEEKEINDWGYRLLQRGENKKAIEVFKLNIELFPGSANAYDSMGEACIKSGDKQPAIEFYKKALELDPNLQSSKKALLELQK